MKKSTAAKKTSSTRDRRPTLEDDMDDRMFKVTVMKRTLFFLVMVSEPPQGSPRLSPALQEMAEELQEELSVEINNCLQMRDILTILTILTKKLGPAKILELLDGPPADIERLRARERQRPNPAPEL